LLGGGADARRRAGASAETSPRFRAAHPPSGALQWRDFSALAREDVRARHTFEVVACVAIVYSRNMNTVSSAHGSGRGSQDETGPFPLEFEVIASRKRVVRREGRSQDETAPFPLEFEVIARRAKQSQDETSPFLLEFMVVLPDGESAFVRTARPPRSRGARRASLRGLPRLKWHGVDASRELREYAARIAAGEKLPPYRGPILANGESPRARPASSLTASPIVPVVDDSKAFVKFALALMVMTALVIASAALGDDAQLRNVGQSISDWLTGRDASFQTLPSAPAAGSSTPQR
jgi:hypothetical protein